MESNTVLTLPKDSHCNWLQDRLRTSGVLMLWPNCPRLTRSNVYTAHREPSDPLNMQVKSYELKSGQLPRNMEHTACQLQQACGQTASAESSGTAKWCPVRVPRLSVGQTTPPGGMGQLTTGYVSEFINWVNRSQSLSSGVFLSLFICQGWSWEGYGVLLSCFSYQLRV